MKLFDIFKQSLKEDMEVDPQGNLVGKGAKDISDANSTTIKSLKKEDGPYNNVYIPNSSIKIIQPNIDVYGDLILTDCKELYVIGSNLTVHGVLDLSGCIKITPEILGHTRMKVGEDLIVADMPVGELIIDHLESSGIRDFYGNSTQNYLRKIIQDTLKIKIEGKIILDRDTGLI